jgi:cytidyltransferase-like protein
MRSFLDLVKEEKSGENHHVMTFGRMNPPTTGHLKLIDKVRELATKHNASHTVVTSHSQDSKKNPLSAAQKIKHLKRYSPGTNFKASTKEHPTFLHHAAELHKKGVTHLHMVVGSDRVKEMKEKLHKYNGSHEGALYHFKHITVHSAGHRDPDAEGTSGMSGTKMREHAKNKDLKSFRGGVPSHVSDTHAKELMHDTRKGMGLHESHYRGMFKAIFVTGGPGSGKDVVLREAIPEARAIELNSVQAMDYLNDKQKLSEKSNDYRREAIRNRSPLIINSPADNQEKIFAIKEELEELGYETLMVFVDTTNEASKDRNEKLTKMVAESVRQDKWNSAQKNKESYNEVFEHFIHFDNSASLEDIEETITDTYQTINRFIESTIFNDISQMWLENHNMLNIVGSDLIKENENVKPSFKFIQKLNEKRQASTGVYRKNSSGEVAAGTSDVTPDNRPSDPSSGDIKWDGNKKRGGYTFRTYTEGQDQKVSNFQKDKETIKKKRYSDSPTPNARLRNTTGLGPEFDTRQQGTVYPMSGLGDVTYREQKEFKSFRKVKEAIDDPGANDMGVGGVLGGSMNKEPMQTYSNQDKNVEVETSKKKKKK